MFFWKGDWPFQPWRDENDVHGVLPKRIESQTCRFVFFAGLEGTGHHVWRSLWKKARALCNLLGSTDLCFVHDGFLQNVEKRSSGAVS